MSLDYTALLTELQGSHPISGAYNADDQLAADQINTLDITRVKALMSGKELFENTESTEYAALTDAKKSEWISFCGITEHDPATGGPVHLFVEYIFGNPSTTRTNLITARAETISRATELGFGVVTSGNIATARG